MPGLRIETFVQSLFARALASSETDDHAAPAYDDDHGGGHGDDEHHSEFGVHVTFDIVYHSVLFFTAIYLAGSIAAKLKMPNLVGEIVAGIVLGPPLLDFVPNPEAFVMLGEIGLILLVLEAGIDIDLTTLKLIGTRGVIIAIVGSVLPIAIGMGISFIFDPSVKTAVAAGAAFGPTSLGIAMNILRNGKIINTPVGQLIVSAAVIDDMIALIILSQLGALVGEATLASILIPIVSALGFLIIGGYVAVFILPPLLNKFIIGRFDSHNVGRVELAIMLALLVGLMPATYYAKASYLMGAFIAGLTFCRSHELHHAFVSQFKRIMQWLMRIFFAASIGFQVPVKDFADSTVIIQGAVFTIALLGKIAVGFMVPNFTPGRRFTGMHFRDCLVTSFSMAAEGEFAFVIAVYCVDNELISKDLYASIVLAVLFSTIVPPFLLRFTITRYNKKAEAKLKEAAEFELGRNMTLNKDEELLKGIKDQTTVFVCIQTQSGSAWGLLPKIMTAMFKMGIEVIDHRSWHPRGVDTTLVNEIYAKDVLKGEGEVNLLFTERVEEITQKLLDAIDQGEDAKVKVTRWYPGVLTEVTEDMDGDDDLSKYSSRKSKAISTLLANEASIMLEKDKNRQTMATKERPIEEILKNVPLPDLVVPGGDEPENGKPRRRVRRTKMMSSPATGGDMWSETKAGRGSKDMMGGAAAGKKQAVDFWSELRSKEAKTGTLAELVVGREVFNVRIAPSALSRVRRGFDDETMLSSMDVSAAKRDDDVGVQNFEHKLAGLVRQPTLTKIVEESVHGDSEIESLENGNNVGGSVEMT